MTNNDHKQPKRVTFSDLKDSDTLENPTTSTHLPPIKQPKQSQKTPSERPVSRHGPNISLPPIINPTKTPSERPVSRHGRKNSDEYDLPSPARSVDSTDNIISKLGHLPSITGVDKTDNILPPITHKNRSNPSGFSR